MEVGTDGAGGEQQLQQIHAGDGSSRDGGEV